MMKVMHVSKHLGENLVLNDINLQIEDGTIFGLIGPNGAGKSTLMRIMAGVYKSDVGCIMLDDEKVFDKPLQKKDILLISDEPFYFFNASLYEMKEFYKACYVSFDEEVYQNYVTLFQLNDHKPLSTFSKGMKRQGFIILGLAIAPRFLLLDEAFDGLDPMMRIHFKRAIEKRLEEKQMSVVISSHDLIEMEGMCDSFGMLEKGSLSTSGNVMETVDHIHKIQLAFKEEVQEDKFKELDLLFIQIESRIVNLVVKGDLEKIESYLRSMEPLLLEVLPVNLEEIFLYEIEQREMMRNE